MEPGGEQRVRESSVALTLAPQFDPKRQIADRDACVGDLRSYTAMSEAKASARVDAYVANVRLVCDGRGPGFVDSVGVWRPVPPQVVSFRMLWPVPSTLGVVNTPDGQDYRMWLLFFDRFGRVVLRVPAYGWERRLLKRWGELAGVPFVDVRYPGMRADPNEIEVVFPGYRGALTVLVGEPFSAAASWVWELQRAWRRRQRQRRHGR